MTKEINQILEFAVAKDGVIDRAHLESRLAGKEKLRIKLGIDPTVPHFHLGFALVLEKLRQFQESGCQCYLVVGDFTAMIGDPADRQQARRVALSEAEIKKNVQNYEKLAGRIIDLKKTHIVYNSTWLEKITLKEWIEIAMKVSVNNLTEREDFAQRLASHQPLWLHELTYPVAQALDSVELKIDVEIGGWDQRLNMLMGRELQKKFGQKPQDIVAVEPLIGLDGVVKMSKSLKNYIAIDDEPSEMFGKVMSIPDDLIENYAQLAAFISGEELNELMKLKEREAKEKVAQKIVERYYGLAIAKEACRQFNATFRDKKVSDDLWEKVKISQSNISLREIISQIAKISLSAADRLIEQGGVRIDGIVEDESRKELTVTKGLRIQIGKRGFYYVSHS